MHSIWMAVFENLMTQADGFLEVSFMAFEFLVEILK
jgi:hypothetical protein